MNYFGKLIKRAIIEYPEENIIIPGVTLIEGQKWVGRDCWLVPSENRIVTKKVCIQFEEADLETLKEIAKIALPVKKYKVWKPSCSMIKNFEEVFKDIKGLNMFEQDPIARGVVKVTSYHKKLTEVEWGKYVATIYEDAEKTIRLIEKYPPTWMTDLKIVYEEEVNWAEI